VARVPIAHAPDTPIRPPTARSGTDVARTLTYGRVKMVRLGALDDKPGELWRAWVGYQAAEFTVAFNAPPLRIVGAALLALRSTG
jgi:hypothetical protein